MEKKNFTKNSFRSFTLSAKFAKWTAVFLVIFTLATSLLPVFQYRLLGEIVNSVIANVGDSTKSRMLIILVIMYALVWSVTQVFSACKSYISKIWLYANHQGFEILFIKKRIEIDLGHHENPIFQNLLTRAFQRGIWPISEQSENLVVTMGSIATFLLASYYSTMLSFPVYVLVIVTSIPAFIVNINR